MGSDFVSTTGAAKLLGCSRRTVGSYLKTGLLRRLKDGNETLIPLKDVEELKAQRDALSQPLNRQTIAQLVARVQLLENAVAVLRRASGLGGEPLRPAAEEAVGLHAAAVRAGRGPWAIEEIELWADTFEKMDEVFFDMLASHVRAHDAWRPFFELCMAQTRQVAETSGFSTSLQLQQLHDRLRMSLRTMRVVVMAWIEAGHGHADALVEPSEALVRRLAAK